MLLDEDKQELISNHIIPLFWQRGEGKAAICREIGKIAGSGIEAFCVEARPHPDFMGAGWWSDLDIIMEEARKRKMKVWLFDDSHYPTGYAAGKLKKGPASLQHRFLREHHVDVLGPLPGASASVKRPGWTDTDLEDARLLAVVAAKRGHANALAGEFIDLTGHVSDGKLYWDVPQGFWRIFFVVEAGSGPDVPLSNYINVLDENSVKVLLDAVYEPFYARYGEDFGDTFAGFFSDEPGFYNTCGFDIMLGQNVPLPWSGGLEAHMNTVFGETWRSCLPMLWQEGDERTRPLRFAYMDGATRLYAKCFTNQIGDWCRARGVQYIGHVLEDNGAHARLGSGAGHYFRAMSGQDMAGVDVVLWQLVPGFDRMPYTWTAGETNGEFFHYGLAKLGASSAHLDGAKNGRAFAELFGAYGWAEGLRLMKWMTDHMLVRGINHIMPHAFSQAQFPDSDCPPHMYARGKNPQYRFYKLLNDYTNRLASWLDGGVHRAEVAVLYHGEAEWSGRAMHFETPGRVLLQNQIDYDIVWGDLLSERAQVAGNRLRIAKESFSCLVIPGCEALPGDLLDKLADFGRKGLPVVFVGEKPCRTSEGGVMGDGTADWMIRGASFVQTPEDLCGYLSKINIHKPVSGNHPYLRYYHYSREENEIWMLCNEHPQQSVETELALAIDRPLYRYDGFEDCAYRIRTKTEAAGQPVPIRLQPFESMVLAAGSMPEYMLVKPEPALQPCHMKKLEDSWQVSFCSPGEYPSFGRAERWEQLINVCDKEIRPQFAGTVRYETVFALPTEPGNVLLDLGAVYETAEVWLNDEYLGARICPPYRYAADREFIREENHLVIEVTGTLAHWIDDSFSRFSVLEPMGLLGPVTCMTKRIC